MWGHPVVFSMGISHLGHLFVRKRKQMNPISDFKSRPPACDSIAQHFGHSSSSAFPQRQAYIIKTQSQASEGHFSMSAVKAQYFLNKNSSSSAQSLGRRLLSARQTSMGSLPSKGEMTSLPTRQEICEMKVLMCCSQQRQHMPAGRSSCSSPNSQLQQQIQQVMPDTDTSWSPSACIQKIIGVQLPLNYRYIPDETMIDRLHQLKSSAALMGCSSSEDDLDNREQPYEDEQGENQIDEKFIEEIKSVRIMIAGLNSNNKRIQTLKHSYAKAIKSAQEKQNSDQMNQILQENAGYQNGITEKLKAIASEVKSSEEKHPNEPETRMKKNFYLNLNKEVRQVLQKQQNFEEQFKNTVKDKVTRQVRLIDRDIDDEQLQEYVDNPQLAQEMLQKKIYGQASTTLKNTVSDIQDKFRDIQKLQASVMQCVQLFNELSALVFAQGEKIDSIEANVAECKDYIQGAEKKLVKAKEHHECSKKCMCIAIVIALVILIIIVIAVVATKA